MTPALLTRFVLCSLAIVLAVVAIGRTGSDVADVVAVALLLGFLGLLMSGIRALLRDEEGTR